MTQGGFVWLMKVRQQTVAKKCAVRQSTVAPHNGQLLSTLGREAQNLLIFFLTIYPAAFIHNTVNISFMIFLEAIFTQRLWLRRILQAPGPLLQNVTTFLKKATLATPC